MVTILTDTYSAFTAMTVAWKPTCALAHTGALNRSHALAARCAP